MNNSDFSKGKTFPLILQFSIPAAISLLISSIYNIVDRIFIGNFVGNTALAALSICFPLTFMMISFGLMCSSGGSTLFTLFRGKKEIALCNRTFMISALLTIIFELVLCGILLLFPDTFLHLFGVTDTTYDMAKEYYMIVALGCLFQGGTFIFCDFVRVSGKPVLGMIITGIGAITNIILDALFVAFFGWGISGAAWATVIGQILSFIFGSYLILHKKTLVNINKLDFSLDFRLAGRILNCGFAFWVAQIAMGFIALVYNGCLGKYGGDTAISSYAIVSSVLTFLIMPSSGISQGIQPLVGFNYSKGESKRVMKIFYEACCLSVGTTSFIWLFVEIFPTTLINIFGGGTDLLALGVPGLRFNFIFAPLLGFIMLATTFFQSLNQPVLSTVITLLRQVIILVPLIYILPMFFGALGIFFAQPISDLCAAIVSFVLIRQISYENIKPIGSGSVHSG